MVKKIIIIVVILTLQIIAIPSFFAVESGEAKPGYVIISHLTEPNLKDIIAYRELQGFAVHFVQTGDIPKQSETLGPQDIRAFLLEKLTEWNVKYLLIVGSSQKVPTMFATPASIDGKVEELNPTPTDFYYSTLVSNWDKDGDGRVGEYPDDGVTSYKPDIYVGRIPLDNPEEVQDSSRQIVEFDSQTDSQKSKVLFAGAMLGFKGEFWGDNELERTDGSDWCEYLYKTAFKPSQLSRYRLYEKSGFLPSPYPCEEDLSSSNLEEHLTKSYGMAIWTAHGSPNRIVRTIWKANSTGRSAPEKADLSQPNLLNTSSVLTKRIRWGIVVSAACSTSCPESYLNMGASFIKQGSASYVGSTRVAWSPSYWRRPEDGGMDTILWLFCKKLCQIGTTTGQALDESLSEFGTKYFFGDREDPIEASQMNIYNMNLYGDPAVCLFRGDGTMKVIVDEPTAKTSPGGQATWRGTYAGQPNGGLKLQVIPDQKDMDWAFPQIELNAGSWGITIATPPNATLGKRFWTIYMNDNGQKFQIPLVLNIVPKAGYSILSRIAPEKLAPYRRFSAVFFVKSETKLTEVTIHFDPDQLKAMQVIFPGKPIKSWYHLDNHFGLMHVYFEGPSNGELFKIEFKARDKFCKTKITLPTARILDDKMSTIYTDSPPIGFECDEVEVWRSKADFDYSGYVDHGDLVMVAERLGQSSNHPLWNARFDLDGNGMIDWKDLGQVVLMFSERSGVGQ